MSTVFFSFLVELTFRRCWLYFQSKFTSWYNLFNLYRALSLLKRATRPWKDRPQQKLQIESCIIVNASIFDIQVLQSDLQLKELPNQAWSKTSRVLLKLNISFRRFVKLYPSNRLSWFWPANNKIMDDDYGFKLYCFGTWKLRLKFVFWRYVEILMWIKIDVTFQKWVWIEYGVHS